MSSTFFPRPADFRRWLEKHHASETELLVGFHKVGSGKPSITWPESVDQALCFGWIDGRRNSLDDTAYTIRFTPRKPGSIWSTVNVGRAQALIEQGLMRPAGLAAFEARSADKSGIYSHEQRIETLEAAHEKLLRKNRAAWTFYQAQPMSYQRAVCNWLRGAKQEATRLRRLELLIADSARQQRLAMFTWKPAAAEKTVATTAAKTVAKKTIGQVARKATKKAAAKPASPRPPR
jgi:uncharacterized protein YdeI (YjbR/CyaY-like superfamily)